MRGESGSQGTSLTTGCNTLKEGLDLVVEGRAPRVSDAAPRAPIADHDAAKDDWHDTVRGGAFHGDEGNIALLYDVTPARACGFGKGQPFCQAR